MARVHEVADIRAVCDALVEELGERALTRDNVQERLRARAEERGHGRVGADHQVVYQAIRACKQDLDAARQQEQQAPAPASDDIALPEGLPAALNRHAQDVQRLVRQALTETLRQSALSTQAQVKQVEVAGAELASELRTQLVMAHEEGEKAAKQLDELEQALTLARAEIAELSSLAESRREALQVLEADWRAQISAAQAALQTAYDARIRAEDGAHMSGLARIAAVGELEQVRRNLSRLEDDFARCSVNSERAEARGREAERALDVARSTIASMTDERDSLRRQLDRALTRPAAEATPRSRRTSRPIKPAANPST
jgi:chromosome segregation ATPase